MTRSIISKFIIILIVLFSALSVFWFFQTSVIKKHILAMIAESKGQISASAISVSGFPLDKNIKIENLKIQPTIDINKVFGANFAAPFAEIFQNNIQIKTLDAKSKIWSNDFIINVGEVNFQNALGEIGLVQFTQEPKINISTNGTKVIKFSYVDSGSKFLDAANNVLSEQGVLLVNFESNFSDEKYHNKVKIEIKDIGNLKFTHNVAPAVAGEALPEVAPNLTEDSVALPEQGKSAEAVEKNPANTNVADKSASVSKENSTIVKPAENDGSLLKKNFMIDMSYVLANKSSTANTATVPLSDTNGITFLESININNFEFSNPLYKTNIIGSITFFQDDSMPVFDMSLKVEKFDNLFIHLKTTISEVLSAKNQPDSGVANAIDAKHNDLAVSGAKPVDSSASNALATVNLDKTIKDLAQKNPATTADVLVFNFKQEKDQDLLINQIPSKEILAQINSNNPKVEHKIPEPSSSVGASPANSSEVKTPATKNSVPTNNQAPVAPAAPTPVAPKVANTPVTKPQNAN